MTHPTKKDLAYDYIRGQILEKRLLPGQRITASQIAEQIGTSVLPVREALLSLEAERLVTITPYVGAVVAWVSADAILDIIRLLAVLEGYATSEAFGHDPAVAQNLPAINARMQAAAEGGDWKAFLDQNRAFHFEIFERAGNEQVVESIRVYWSQLEAMLVATSFHAAPGRTKDDLRDHEHLITLLADRHSNPLEIELAARRHRMRTAALYAEQEQARAR